MAILHVLAADGAVKWTKGVVQACVWPLVRLIDLGLVSSKVLIVGADAIPRWNGILGASSAARIWLELEQLHRTFSITWRGGGTASFIYYYCRNVMYYLEMLLAYG